VYCSLWRWFGIASIFLTPVADPPTTPFAIDTGLNSPPYSDNWVSYILGVSTDDGSKIQAVDVKLKGIFHQRWGWNADTLGFDATPTSLNTTSGDSHLLPDANALLPVPPTEDNNAFLTPQALPDVPELFDYGVGSSIKGVWAFPGSQNAVTSVNLAYLVIPRGSESQLEYEIKGYAGTGDKLFDLTQGSSFPPPPAPPPPPSPPPPPPPPTPPTTYNPISGAGHHIQGTATLIKDPSVGVPFGSGGAGTVDATLGAPWVSYKLTIQSRDTTLIQAVQASITGPLHQRWTASNADGVYDTVTANSTNATNADSHFMAASTMLFAEGPAEDNPLTGSPLSASNDFSGYGVGNGMSAIFGPPGAGLASLNVAYVVIPRGSEDRLNMVVNVFDPNGHVVGSLTSSDFGVNFIPESASIVLAGFGALGLFGLVVGCRR
jgi:hypothetical protein